MEPNRSVFPELRVDPIGRAGSGSSQWLLIVLLVVGVVLLATIASVNLRRPDATCPHQLPQVLVDDDAGMSLCLPSHWREIRAEDEDAWRAIFDDNESDAERWIKDGSMQHFAVPFSPRDEDKQVHLAIYIRVVPPLTSLEVAQSSYRDQLETDETILSTDVRELETETAGLIVSERQRLDDGDAVIDHYLNWIFVEGGRAYYILMASSDIHANDYRELFNQIAETVRLGVATMPSATPPSVPPH